MKTTVFLKFIVLSMCLFGLNLSQTIAQVWLPSNASNSTGIYRTGKVGIGMSAAPVYGQLEVRGNNAPGDLLITSQPGWWSALHLKQTNYEGWALGKMPSGDFVMNYDLSIGNYTNWLTILKSNGNVGLSTSSPAEKLHVFGSNVAAVIGNTGSGYSALRFLGSYPDDFAYIQAGTSNSDGTAKLKITRYQTENSPIADFQVYSDKSSFYGKVVVGNGVNSLPSGYQLYVADGILTEKVKVAVKTTSNWSDYVFAGDYPLQPLECVEEYVKQNKHLPGVPSAGEMVQQGLDVAAMDAKLLEKIEELTLYLIELKKENEALKTRISKLENR